MQIKEITKIQYILQDYEWKIVDQCLRYCLHRLVKHPECGLHKARINKKDVKKLLVESDSVNLKYLDEQLDKILETEF